MNHDYRERDRQIWQGIFANLPQEWFDAGASHAMRLCRDFFESHPARRILDLGCGFGRWAVFLASHLDSAVFGVDYAYNGVRAAATWAERAGSTARFLLGTADRLPFRPGAFDGVLAALLLDNLSEVDLHHVVREVTQASQRGARGVFVFNPVLTEIEPAQVPEENPTKGCMHVSYSDDELADCLVGWAVTRITPSAEGFRIVEAVRA